MHRNPSTDFCDVISSLFRLTKLSVIYRKWRFSAEKATIYNVFHYTNLFRLGSPQNDEKNFCFSRLSRRLTLHNLPPCTSYELSTTTYLYLSIKLQYWIYDFIIASFTYIYNYNIIIKVKAFFFLVSFFHDFHIGYPYLIGTYLHRYFVATFIILQFSTVTTTVSTTYLPKYLGVQAGHSL